MIALGKVSEETKGPAPIGREDVLVPLTFFIE